jgi:hypothetical protein
LAFTLLKPVPDIVTNVPEVPNTGEILLMARGRTRNSLLLRAVTVARVTEIFPVVDDCGTVTVRLDADELRTLASTPLNSTMFSAGVELKPVPLIVTDDPTVPLDGVNAVTERVPPKLSVLVAVTPFTVTVILPAVFPAGTTAVIPVGEQFVIVAVTPLNLTILFAGTVLNPLPFMKTFVPAVPRGG